MDADRAKYQFGGSASVRADAEGRPGQRRFFLMLSTGTASARLWIEKEQLRQLSGLIRELLETAEIPESAALPGLPPSNVPSGARAIEFQVGRIGLAYDTSRDAALVLINDAEEARENARPTVSFWLGRADATLLAEQATKVVNAGRPACPLCGASMDPAGHVCPRSNGHGKVHELA